MAHADPVSRAAPPAIRIGHGFDLHRLEPASAGGRPFVLGGVRIEHDRGPVGHSDGDVLLHAVTDALLGAIAGPDIGELFPDDDPSNEGRDSAEFLAAALERVGAAGLALRNLDCTVVCERPRLAPHKQRIRDRLAALLGVPHGVVNVKGKSNEGVDAIGEGRAIAAHAVVLLAAEGRR